MGAYGFHYSAPTIKVKLSQEVVAPTPTPTPVATPTTMPTQSAVPTSSEKPVVAKRTTITCVKGKLSKKVTAVKPKCPSGYKKR
jgi:hypothetical protein